MEVLRRPLKDGRAAIFHASGSCTFPGRFMPACAMAPECETLMNGAFDALGPTGRSCGRILRVTRMIADLDGSETLQPAHIAEAVQYRSYEFDKN